ncbi:MAG: hypothetical protein ACP5SH_20710 [Syntrophobacteraceae bacterium]
MGFYKRHRERFQTFPEQLDIALRYHCEEGNLKWVSLLLYAGADPYSVGPDNSLAEPDPELFTSALEIASRRGHIDILKMKKIVLDPAHPLAPEIMRWACWPEKSEVLEFLLEKGFNPERLDDAGSSLIQNLLSSAGRTFNWGYPFSSSIRQWIDNSRSMGRIKMVHLLVRIGARWMPADNRQINDVRRSLLKLKPDYTAEFIWIMSGCRACQPEHLEQLMKPPSIRTHVAAHLPRIDELIESSKLTFKRTYSRTSCDLRLVKINAT